MKRKLFLAAGTMLLLNFGQAQIHMPQPSPTQTIKQNFGASSIELIYSRPGLKGRRFIGDIEPYGVIWRTGANSATQIIFHDSVEILGHKVDSGAYAIYTIPRKEGNWTFILNRGIHNDGVRGYKQSDDVFRENVRAQVLKPKLETFTMQFANLQPESCDLLIQWESFSLSIPIETNIKDRLRKEIESALQTEQKPYWQAAQFYHEYDHNEGRALGMINDAIKQNAGNDPYYMVYYKAMIQKTMGDKNGALQSAEQSLEMARKEGNANYELLNHKLIESLK